METGSRQTPMRCTPEYSRCQQWWWVRPCLSWEVELSSTVSVIIFLSTVINCTILVLFGISWFKISQTRVAPCDYGRPSIRPFPMPWARVKRWGSRGTKPRSMWAIENHPPGSWVCTWPGNVMKCPDLQWFTCHFWTNLQHLLSFF